MGWAVLIGSTLAVAATELDTGAMFFDILAPFRTHLMFAAVAGVFAVLWPRRALLAFLSAGVISVGFHTALAISRQVQDVAKLAPSRIVDADKGGVPVVSRRILFANAWENNMNRPAFTAFLRSAPADVVVVAEHDQDEWPELVPQLAAEYPYHHTCVGKITCKVAIFSRVPFAASGYHRKTWEHPPVVWVRFAGGVMGEEPLTVLGTHLWRPTRNPFRHRFQLENLADILRHTEGAVVLAGDFNAPDWSQGMLQMMQAGNLRSPDCHLPSWPAWPVTLPVFSIDHILVSPGISIRRIGLGPAVGSDHLPVWADIVMKQGVATKCGA